MLSRSLEMDHVIECELLGVSLYLLALQIVLLPRVAAQTDGVQLG